LGDPRLRQQIRAQQLGQRPGIDPIVFQPRRRDRLAPARVRQVRLQLEVIKQLGQPGPAVRGLERHRRARRQPAEDFHQVR
jgi:hypothetical protein